MGKNRRGVMALTRWVFAIGLLLLAMMMQAQPGNPTYSLSTNTFFEIDLRPIALLDLETTQATTSFTMTVPAPTEAGEGMPANPLVTYVHNWLNYSSAVGSGTSRNITVNISSGSVPAGFELRLLPGGASGSGAGTRGTPTAPVVLTTTPQNILTGIRGCYTGDGTNNGHQLTYTLDYVGPFSDVESQNPTITILYTLIDN